MSQIFKKYLLYEKNTWYLIHYIHLGGPQPAILQEVSVPVWSNSECKLKYGAAAPGGIVDSFLCAGRANKDSCSVCISSWFVISHSYLVYSVKCGCVIFDL